MLLGRKLEGLGSLVLLGEGKIQQLFVRKSTGRSSLWSRALGATPVAADLFVPVDRLLCDISLPCFRSFWQQVCVESKCTGALFQWMWRPVFLKEFMADSCFHGDEKSNLQVFL